MLSDVLLSPGITTTLLPKEIEGLLHSLGKAVEAAAVNSILSSPTSSGGQGPRMPPHLPPSRLHRQLFTGNDNDSNPSSLNPEEADKWWALLTDPAFQTNWNGPRRAMIAGPEGQRSREELSGMSIGAFCNLLVLSTLATCAGKKLITARGEGGGGGGGGYLGIATPQAQEGDCLVYLFGFFAPFLLRPRDGHYAMVGAVRLAGLEEAGLIEGHCAEKKVEEGVFRIR
jgi:hypothetical protein